MEIVMESIQELLRKLCKCIVKSDDGYKINIELEKSDPEPGPDPDPGPPTPDPEIDPNSPEAKFDPNIPLFIENAQDTPIHFRMECRSEGINNRNISYSYDNITWQPLIFTKKSSSYPYISNNIILYRKGDRAYFKGDAANGLVSETIYPAIFSTIGGIPPECCVDVGGNITSLFYGKDDKFKTDYLDLSNITHTSSDSMMGRLFGTTGTMDGRPLSTYIRTPPALPATTLCPGCYEAFFYNLNSDKVRLEYIPVLPAKKLETNCYKLMFYSRESARITDKTDKFYCFKILAENTDTDGFYQMAKDVKYIQVNNPNIIGSLLTYEYGIVYCPIDPGSKLPVGWKWIKIPPME